MVEETRITWNMLTEASLRRAYRELGLNARRASDDIRRLRCGMRTYLEGADIVPGEYHVEVRYTGADMKKWDRIKTAMIDNIVMAGAKQADEMDMYETGNLRLFKQFR